MRADLSGGRHRPGRGDHLRPPRACSAPRWAPWRSSSGSARSVACRWPRACCTAAGHRPGRRGSRPRSALGLVRRFVGRSLTLAEPRELFRFVLLGAPVACLVSASVATLAHDRRRRGARRPGQRDLGHLVDRRHAGRADRRADRADLHRTAAGRVAPPPPGRWRCRCWPRRCCWRRPRPGSIAADDKRVRSRLRARCLGARRTRGGATEGAAACAAGDARACSTRSSEIEPEEMRLASRAWLEDQPLSAGHRLQRAGAAPGHPGLRAASRRRRPRAGLPGLRPAATARRSRRRRRRDGDPLHRAAGGQPTGAGGQRSCSIPAARAAIAEAVRQRQASGQRRLPADPGHWRSDRHRALPGAVSGGLPTDAAARQAALRGVVFVTLRLDAMLTDVLADRAELPATGVCRTRHRAWPGRAWPAAEGCESAASATLDYDHVLDLAGRPLRLRVWRHRRQRAGAGRWRRLGLFGGRAAARFRGWVRCCSSSPGASSASKPRSPNARADLQAASHALRESQERLRNIVDHVPIGVVYADAAGRVHEANPSLLAMLGLAALPTPPRASGRLGAPRRPGGGAGPGARARQRRPGLGAPAAAPGRRHGPGR